MGNNINIIELLGEISAIVIRIEDNCEEKQGIENYRLYNDVVDIQVIINQIKNMLDK